MQPSLESERSDADTFAKEADFSQLVVEPEETTEKGSEAC